MLTLERLKKSAVTAWKPAVFVCAALALALVIAWSLMPTPTVSGVLQGAKAEVQKNDDFGFNFSVPMEHRSVERAFSISPKISGDLQWRGNRLMFVPAASLEKGATFKVTIGRGARTPFFKSLSSAFSQEFAVRDDPEISVLAPVDGAVIRPAQTLTVLFDRPLRELTGSLEVPPLLSFTPALKGEYHWQGTSGFEFVPTAGWAPATSYEVKLSGEVRFLDGTVLQQKAPWHFSTPSLSVEPVIGQTKLDPKAVIRLTFNYPISPDAVRKALVVHERSMPGIGQPGNPSEPQELPKYAMTATTENDSKTILLRKAGGFRLGSAYEVSLPQGFTGGVGPNGLSAAYTASFTMDELGFRILGTCPEAEQQMETDSSFVIGLNNPPDQVSLESAVTVIPEPKDFRVSPYGWGGNCGGTNWPQSISLTGRWKASTDYTITVRPTFADQYGQAVGKAITYKVKTKPYRASIDVSGFGGLGVLAAHTPRVFQLRALNVSDKITATLCAISTQAYVRQDRGECRKLGQKLYDAKTTLNDYKVLGVDLDDIAGRTLPPGTYALQLGMAPGSGHPELLQSMTQFLAVTDTALTLKRDNAGKMVVWANDIATGAVASGLSVTAYETAWNADVKRVADGKTGQDGLVSFDTPAGSMDDFAAVASDGTHFGIGLVSWSDGISPWNFNLQQTYPISDDEGYIGFLHTDRLIYRPDQMVYFKGEVRKDVDASLTLPDEREIDVAISDANGTQVADQTLPLSSYGTFSGSLKLEPSMPLGTYQLVAAIHGHSITGTFDVREYRRPDFKVALSAPNTPVASGDVVRLPLHVEYYYGTPLAGARVDYTVTRRPSFFQPLYGEWFSFTESDDSYCYWYCRTQEQVENVKSGSGILDADGNFVIGLPISLGDYRSGATYSISATVIDVNQRQVSANGSFDAQKGSFQVGIRPDPAQPWNSADAGFDLVALGLDGKPMPGIGGSVQFFKRTWSSVKKSGTLGETFYDWTHVDMPVGSAAFSTDSEGKARVSFSPKDDGEYLALAKAVDARGRTITSSVSRWVDRGNGASVRVSDDHVMKIIQDKASYKVGDVASLEVQTPYVATKALVTVERDHIRSWRVVDLGAVERNIRIPITEDMAPNAYVSVVAVQGGGDGLPDFRLGYADLQVDTATKVLSMEVIPDKQTYKPGDEVTLTVTAKRSDGSPTVAEASVAVVDERVVALLGTVDRNILGRFWFPRQIGVATAQTITRIIKKLFVETQGGGGGKGGDGGGPAIRGNFLDTAYWKADVVTGTDGRATVKFKLPDNLTTWQILAIGTTKDTVVGSALTDVVTRRDLMAEPLLPRFVRTGDTVTFGTTVSNLTGKGAAVRVKMAVEGATLDGEPERLVTLAAHDRMAVNWTARVPMSSTSVKITASAEGGGLSDGFETTIPSLGYSVPETVEVSNLFGRSASEKISIPDGILPDSGVVKLRVASSVGTGLQGGIDYLLNYEYGCTEQTASTLVASLTYERLVKAKLSEGSQGLVDLAHAKALEGIKRLSSQQRPDGGWALWVDSEREYPFLTAYTYWSLSLAEQSGYEIDAHVMEKAGSYLKNYMAQPAAADAVGLSANERAQVLMALADHDPANLSGYAQGLYEDRSKLSTYGKSFLAMALAKIDGNASRAAKLLDEVKAQMVFIDPSTAYVSEDEGYDDYFMSSDVRSTGLYLQALMRVVPKDDNADRLMRYLIGKKVDGHWYDTQSTAMTLAGLLAYVERHPVDTTPFDVRVSLDHVLATTLSFDQGDLSAERAAHWSLSDLAAKGKDHLFELQKDSEKRYFYDLSMTYSREIEKIAPFDNGFTVLAGVYALSDPKHQHPLSQTKQGDTVRVHMKVIVPKERRYVALEYHLPAGLEAIDTGLRTSPQYFGDTQQNCAPDWWSGEQVCLEDWEQGWWWENAWKHIEQRDDRVFLSSDQLQPGIYEYEFLASAVTPGEFRVPPTRAYEFYKPQANGHDEGRVFSVLPK